MRDTITKVWKGELRYMRWLFVPLLYPLSQIYGICLKIREHMYKQGRYEVKESPIPVVSVGNITLGGTGKTPLVERVAMRLKEEGFRPGIITRGYKRKKKGIFAVDPGSDRARDTGDEALMLARKTKVPVIVGADRSGAILHGIEKFNINVALLDDGFQRRDLRKDIEILVLNGSQQGGAEDLFPLGPFREPAERIRDAHIVMVNKGQAGEWIQNLIGDGVRAYQMRYKPFHLNNMKENTIGSYRYLEGKRVLAFSGLGDNESFFQLVRSLGAQLVRSVSFADHYAYRQSDLDSLASYGDVEMLVTTEKDAVRLEGMNCPVHLFYLTVELEIEYEDKFFEQITRKIAREACLIKS